ncbi:PREDICTED: 5'-methylthioadenosine/S-adenosylhomocysteine nucleosidase-like isoform X14 [Acropora digitifera]|uniref:5'-methylthioadenosine/S-adenosylhomocysteine nucleosidase-like isoform X14 n=1 Tax=Acropora digitifera TaxID=70779 RepID=UPI00077B1896|nr:PREDICTED: 5'-methylthioadenosine/S-adenosylhomocysteine nucleosidase-like isoform X14 [Acropora digitifera]
MSEAAAQSGSSEGRLSNPPELDVVLLKPRDLPKRSVKWKDVPLPTDILLLTVKECEFFSCLSYLNPSYCKSYAPEIGWLYLGEMGDGEAKLKVAVIQCNMGSGVPQGSTIVVPKAVRALRPKAVICVGFCAGLKEKKVKCGDVIISSKLATYAPTKVTGDGITERGVQVPASPRLSELLRSADHGWEVPLKNPNELDVEVHKGGLLLSGPEVVSSDTRRKELIKRYPDAIGVEMEGEGLCATADALCIEWVVIKGVSDYAGDNKSDSDPWRLFCSLMAVSLVAHALSAFDVFQE